jgi:hypothetical protein
MTSSTEQLAPALDVDARLTGIERGLTLLLNVTPVNAAKAWADFERSDFGTVPTLRLRPLEFEPLDREVLQPPWVRPRWLDVPGAGERLDKLRAGVSVIDLYEGDGSG